jgi:dienelactone hydrolase
MRAIRLLPLLGLVLALAGCGGGGEPAAERDPTPVPEGGPFAFDRDADLDVAEGETSQEPQFTAKALSYASPGGDRVSGIVVVPKGEPRPAGVVFMHGAGGSRIDFLADAAQLAKAGAVTLTIDSPFSRSESEPIRAGAAPPETIRELMIQNAQDLVRGLDVLVREYDADPARLGVVGYSMGVQAAATAAALDGRPKAVVLIAGRANPSRTPGDAAWERLFRSIDTVHFLPDLAPAAVLVQGGKRDRVIPRAELEELYAATSRPKEIRWYDTGHALSRQAGRDRVAWLSTTLGLK